MEVGSPTENNITTQPNSPPAVPILVTPANNSAGVSLQGDFFWYESKGADSYTLQIGSDSLFANKIYEQNGLKSLTMHMSGLNILTKYYWRVNATNSSGTSAFSSTWAFTTSDSTISFVTISGKVTNSSGAALAGVKIYTVPATSTVYTDSTGNYMINNISTGSYAVHAEKEGFSNYFINIYVQQGQTYEYNLTLTLIGSVSTCGEIPTITYGGKTYNLVQIGNQCWLKENIDIGTMINGSSNQTDNGSIEKYCYENKSENCDTYGGLYLWGEATAYADSAGEQGICPAGWHIPTKSDFQALVVATNNNSRGLRAVGEGAGTNTTGFSALLAGYRFTAGNFYSLREHATFWSSTQYSATDANYLGLRIGDNTVDLGAGEVAHGFSVRCVKND
ncbi:MAG: carboxypeptidase regulatory-like domain-containing protein [Ignavibacteriaceae bacterium]|jgi:uncharacterized protein (TIGR02145 family)|nr:carboxypeptidase regulatory-like domain-containing protein [Ignavibacteriaceae bacterium]